MRKQNMAVTLTLPIDLVQDLRVCIPKKQLSKFIAELLKKGLEVEKQKWALEFREASQDSKRNAEIEIWNSIN